MKSAAYSRLGHFLRRGQTHFRIFLGMLSKKHQFSGPKTLHLEIPVTCNHDCVFCCTEIHGSAARDAVKKGMSHEKLLQVIEEGLAMGVAQLNLASLGEPMLYAGIKDLISHAHKSHRDVVIKVITNGTSISRLGLEFIEKYRLHLWLSLHGGEFQTWKAIHRPLSPNPENIFDELKNHITSLARSGQAKITLHNVINKLNYDKLDSIVDFAIQTGVKDLNFQHLLGAPELQLSQAEASAFLRETVKVEPLLRKHRISNNLRVLKLGFSDREKFYETNRCYAGWLFSVVDVMGNVRACCGGKKIASLRVNSYREIWNVHVAKFRREGIDIHRTGGVAGCHCATCPLIDLNYKANRLLFWRPWLSRLAFLPQKARSPVESDRALRSVSLHSAEVTLGNS